MPAQLPQSSFLLLSPYAWNKELNPSLSPGHGASPVSVQLMLHVPLLSSLGYAEKAPLTFL